MQRVCLTCGSILHSACTQREGHPLFLSLRGTELTLGEDQLPWIIQVEIAPPKGVPLSRFILALSDLLTRQKRLASQATSSNGRESPSDQSRKQSRDLQFELDCLEYLHTFFDIPQPSGWQKLEFP